MFCLCIECFVNSFSCLDLFTIDSHFCEWFYPAIFGTLHIEEAECMAKRVENKKFDRFSYGKAVLFFLPKSSEYMRRQRITLQKGGEKRIIWTGYILWTQHLESPARIKWYVHMEMTVHLTVLKKWFQNSNNATRTKKAAIQKKFLHWMNFNCFRFAMCRNYGFISVCSRLFERKMHRESGIVNYNSIEIHKFNSNSPSIQIKWNWIEIQITEFKWIGTFYIHFWSQFYVNFAP